MLEFVVPKPHDVVTEYFIFKSQSHYSGMCGQRFNRMADTEANFTNQTESQQVS